MVRTRSQIKGNSKLPVQGESDDERPRRETTPRPPTIADLLRSAQAAHQDVTFDPDSTNRRKLPSESRRQTLDEICRRVEATTTLSQDDMLSLWALLHTPYSSHQRTFDVLRDSLLSLLCSNLALLVHFTNLVVDCQTIERRSNQTQNDFLDAVAEAIVMISINASNTTDATPSERTRNLGPALHVSVAALSQFTKTHYILGRYEAIRGMLKSLLVQMSSACSTDLQTLYVPFLQQLVALMLIWGVPLFDEVYRLFFQSVLHEYFARVIGAAPRDTDCEAFRRWKRQGETAWTTLNSIEHNHLLEILGPWYESHVVPKMRALEALLKD